MRISMAGAVALMTLAGIATVGTALAADAPMSSLMTVKIGVTDFKKSTDYYVKYLGMKEGAQYNPAEKAVDWQTTQLKGASCYLTRSRFREPYSMSNTDSLSWKAQVNRT